MHASEVWEGDGLRARIARTALLPASLLYAAGWECYLGLYRLGLKHAKEPHRPVVCVGNLVVGGSGKSPLTRYVAQTLRGMGRKVVVSCSGYGSPAAEAATVAPDGPLSAREWGDEPAMLRWLEPELPLIVGRRRVLAAELCHRRFPDSAMVMDDGFQHLPLRKHITIVIDSPDPRNRFCLPAGPYREPRFNRRRADLLVPCAMDAESALTGFVAPDGGALPLESLSGAQAAFLCALGQPQKFLDSLRAAGIDLRGGAILQDHDPLSAGNLLDALPTDLPVIVTAKDWVKLRERDDVGTRRFLVALHELRVRDADRFREWLEAKLHGIETATSQ